METDAKPAEDAKGAATGTPDAKPGEAATPATYDEAAVASKVSAAVNAALKAEREKQAVLLVDTTKDSESKLAELTAKAEEAEKRSEFVEAATAAGIRNTKAAWLVAKHGDYINAKGAFDANAFRKDNPEFFAPAPKANAGEGAGAVTPPADDMNALLRAAAGRG